MYMVKRDGRQEAVHFDKITARLNKLSYGLSIEYCDSVLVAKKVCAGVYKGVTTSQLDELVVETAAAMIAIHPDYASVWKLTEVHKVYTYVKQNIFDLLDRTKMAGAKPPVSPTVLGIKLSSIEGSLLEDPTDYRQMIGALQYCTLTHPDVAYAVNQLFHCMHQPRTSHWHAMKRVLRYLKCTVNHGLYYTPSPLELDAYCDSDWADNPGDTRSTSSYGVFVGKNLVSWSSKKQNIISRSSRSRVPFTGSFYG